MHAAEHDEPFLKGKIRQLKCIFLRQCVSQISLSNIALQVALCMYQNGIKIKGYDRFIVYSSSIHTPMKCRCRNKILTKH